MSECQECERLKAELEQERVQHAGCLTAAEGCTKDPAVKGQFGWSLAYQKTLELRLKYDALLAELAPVKASISNLRELWEAERTLRLDADQKLARAKAENARLDAALKHWQMDARTFEELLAPTIELLVRLNGPAHIPKAEISIELARLRALAGESKS